METNLVEPGRSSGLQPCSSGCGDCPEKTISRITDRVIDERQSWQTRPLDGVYAAVFIDAIVVKVRDGQVANRPFYAAIGVTPEGERDIAVLWAGPVMRARS